MEAVGSSMMTTLAFLATALAISTICRLAMDRSRMRVLGDTWQLKYPSSSWARLYRARSSTKGPLESFMPMKMLSITVMASIWIISWYTTEMPSSRDWAGVMWE